MDDDSKNIEVPEGDDGVASQEATFDSPGDEQGELQFRDTRPDIPMEDVGSSDLNMDLAPSQLRMSSRLFSGEGLLEEAAPDAKVVLKHQSESDPSQVLKPPPAPIDTPEYHPTIGFDEQPASSGGPAWASGQTGFPEPEGEDSGASHKAEPTVVARIARKTAKQEAPSLDPVVSNLPADDRGSSLSAVTVVAMVALMGACLLPIGGKEGVVSPLQDLLAFQGVSFQALVGFFLALFSALVPIGVVWRALYLVAVGGGIFALGVLDCQEALLRQVFHGHPLIPVLATLSGAVLVLGSCVALSTSLYSCGRESRFGANVFGLAGVALTGVALLALDMISSGALASPIGVLWTTAQTGLQGDRLAIFTLLGSLGLVALGWILAWTSAARVLTLICGFLSSCGFAGGLLVIAFHVSHGLPGVLEPLKIMLLLGAGLLLVPAALGQLVVLVEESLSSPKS